MAFWYEAILVREGRCNVGVASPIDPIENIPNWLTVEEAAQHLRVTKKSVYAAIREGQLQYRKIGKWIQIPSSEVLPATVIDAAGAYQP